MIFPRDVSQPRVLQQAWFARRAAFRRRFIGDDQALAPFHQPDSADDARARNFSVDPEAGQRRDFQKVRSFIEQRFDPLPRQQLALGLVTLVVFPAAALGRTLQFRAQPLDRRDHPGVVGAVCFRARIDEGRKQQASYSI